MRLSKRKNTNKKYDLVYIITKLVRLMTLFLSMVTVYLVGVKPIYTFDTGRKVPWVAVYADMETGWL